MIKKFYAISIFSIFSVFAATLCGCSKKEKETVNLEIWTDETNKNVITERLEEFKKIHEDEAVFNFTIIEESSKSCLNIMEASPAYTPDVFVYTSGQFKQLYTQGYISEITYEKDSVIADHGGPDSAIIKAVTINDKLYAYPELNSNGYFMYYNKKYFKTEDLSSLERMIEVAASHGKKITMDLHNGWYLYSFFKGAGLDVSINEDGNANHCNWNATNTKYKGVDIARTISKIAQMPGFKSYPDSNFIELIKNPNSGIIAGINGAWNANNVRLVWGDDYDASKLPTFKLNGDNIQMHSFAGYKLVSVNSKTKHPQWAQKVAHWITNEESQVAIFKNTGECPSNLKAASHDEIKASPALTALASQSKFAHVQFTASSLWTPTKMLGIMLTEGLSPEIDLQSQLDQTVAAIQMPE